MLVSAAAVPIVPPVPPRLYPKTGSRLLRDLGSPEFQANTAARLAEIFAQQRKDNIDLLGVAVVAQQLTLLPQIEANGMMRMNASIGDVVPLDLIEWAKGEKVMPTDNKLITITPEMISAGNDALAGFWTELTTSHCALAVIPDAVAAVYKAMESVRLEAGR